MSRSPSPFLLVVRDGEDDDYSDANDTNGGALSCKLEPATCDSAEDERKLRQASSELDAILSSRHDLLESLKTNNKDNAREKRDDGQRSIQQEIDALMIQLRMLEEERDAQARRVDDTAAITNGTGGLLLPHPVCNTIAVSDEACDAWFATKMTQAEQFAISNRVIQDIPSYDPTSDPVVEECFSCRISYEPLVDPHHLFGMTFSGEPLKKWVQANKKHPILHRPATLDDIFPDIGIRDAMDRHVKREQELVEEKRKALQRAFVREKVLSAKTISLGEDVRRQMESYLTAEADAREKREVARREVLQQAEKLHADIANISRKILALQASRLRHDDTQALIASAASSAATSDVLRHELLELANEEDAKRREVQLLTEAIALRRRVAQERKLLWEPEKPNCSICGATFSLLVHRGRCHRCGINVCYSCSQNVGRPLQSRQGSGGEESSRPKAVPICQRCFGSCHREMKLRQLHRSGTSAVVLPSCSSSSAAMSSPETSPAMVLEDGFPLFEVPVAGTSWFAGDFDLNRALAIRSALSLVDASPQGGIGVALEVLSDVVVPGVVGYITAACEYCKDLLPPAQHRRSLR